MVPSLPLATADLVLVAVALPMVLAALVGLIYSVQLGDALFYDPPNEALREAVTVRPAGRRRPSRS